MELYGQYCPIVRATEISGDRWTPLIIREYDVDLIVTGHVADLYRAWVGRISLSEALRDGIIQVDGLPALVRAFPRWLQLPPFVDVVRAAAQRSPETQHARST